MSDVDWSSQRRIYDLSPYSYKVKFFLSSENMPVNDEYLAFMKKNFDLIDKLASIKEKYPLAYNEIQESLDTFLVKITNTVVDYQKADEFYAKMNQIIIDLAIPVQSDEDPDMMDNIIDSLSFNLNRIKKREEQTNKLKQLMQDAEDMKDEIINSRTSSEETE
ncbi:hypothetical protein PVA45_07450 (plasmid) [Entomospira entomophila]|uniref:Uncharacterized protein n=1 Tax=Entomospira entomophila TaxID=2719988 RepID=A0A968GBG0_9SPIO|nr:hypothetical protein [Entomospira entomophilus]NIZ41305.1 hypothetical protein [Entomospira entomophilus]WDI36172.1 hypothetical protein PVA45_07450 [Entomospira entomophilus]